MNDQADTRDEQLTGQTFKQAREQMGLSQEQVAKELKLAVRAIDALEQLASLDAADVYQRGYLRRYAKRLQLQWHAPETPCQPSGNPVPIAEDLLPRKERQARSLGWVLGLVVGVSAAFWYTQHQRPAEPEAPRTPIGSASHDLETVHTEKPRIEAKETLPTEIILSSGMEQPAHATVPAMQAESSMASRLSPIAEAKASPRTPKANLNEIHHPEHYLLQFRGDAWVEVRDGDGQRVAYRMFHAGEQLPLKGKPPFHLLIGDYHQSIFRMDGRAVDLAPYARGNVVKINTNSLLGNTLANGAGTGSTVSESNWSSSLQGRP